MMRSGHDSAAVDERPRSTAKRRAKRVIDGCEHDGTLDSTSARLYRVGDTGGLLARLAHCGVVLGRFKAVRWRARRLAALGGAPRAVARSAALIRPPRHALRRLPSGRKAGSMLRIYETMIGVMGRLKPVMTQIEAHDRDLARQLKRASSSVALNLCEGSGSHGGTRKERYRNALGSARETGACIDVAVALGYVESVDAGLLDALDKVRATLVRVLR
jgi:four helix bundle protein